MNITIKSGSDIPSNIVRDLFVRNQWNHWLTEEDIQLYLSHAYYVAAAWDNSALVGIAVLVGDGRKYLELENLLVDEKYQHQGIGKTLMTNIMQAISKAKPYAVKVEVFQEKTENFYQQFGFTKNKETWLLQLTAPDALRPKTT